MNPILLVAGLLAGLLLWAAIDDARRRIIPNWLTATVAIGAIGWWWANGLPIQPDILLRVAFAIGAFLVFAGLFALGAMGGGDVKLIAAVALWLTPFQLLRMLVWMALLGGVLTVAMLVRARIRRDKGTPEIPYGVAIVAATLFVLANDLLTNSAA